MSSVRACAVSGALALAAALVVLIAIASGSDGVSLRDLHAVMGGEGDALRMQVLRELRVPRVGTAFACGALLAVAGALMQVLFRNPLADPYILGLAGGASAGALGAMAFGAGAVSAASGAWAGSLLSLALLLACVRLGCRERVDAPEGGRDVQRLLLTGVALASGWAAVVTLVLALAPDSSLKGLLFWMMGDLEAAEDWRLPAVVAVAVAAGGWWLARDLNVLCLGGLTAHALGISVGRTRLWAMLLASLATAAAITTAGTIGFVGLIVPNAVRWLLGNDQRWLLPASMVCGGTLLTGADALARTVIAPMQLPVGAIVALVGVPAFVAILARGRLFR